MDENILKNIGNEGIHRIIVTDEMFENGDFANKFLSVQELLPGGGKLIPVVYRSDKDVLSFSRTLFIIAPKEFPGVRVIFCFWKKFSIFEYTAYFSDFPRPKALALEPFQRIDADSSLTISEMDQLLSAPEPKHLYELMWNSK